MGATGFPSQARVMLAFEIDRLIYVPSANVVDGVSESAFEIVVI